MFATLKSSLIILAAPSVAVGLPCLPTDRQKPIGSTGILNSTTNSAKINDRLIYGASFYLLFQKIFVIRIL
jgi:hypothetical protein